MIFLLFASPNHIALFLNYLNSQHPNINFTQETEVNNCLPFLDILITRANGSFSTSVFHKPTFTGLYTNYNSFIPSVYKTGLISSLLNRYFSICSSYFIFDSHLQNVKKTLLLNGYPNSFIDTCIRRFLDKIFSPSPKFRSPLRRSFTFVFPKLDNIASKFALRFGSYALVLFLTLTSALFSALLSDCLTFLSSQDKIQKKEQDSQGLEIWCCLPF